MDEDGLSGSYSVGFRLEDWMNLPTEKGTDVISPPRVTNISDARTVLKQHYVWLNGKEK